MSLKLIHKSEIHKITNQPQNFFCLLKTIREVFSDDLPSQFTLRYEDNEGDMVVISNDDDYQLARESEPLNNSKCLKIFLNDADESNNISIISRASILGLSPRHKQGSDSHRGSFDDALAFIEPETTNLHNKTFSNNKQDFEKVLVEEPSSGVTVMKVFKTEIPESKNKKLDKQKGKNLNDDVNLLLEELLIGLQEDEKDYDIENEVAQVPIHEGIQCDICGIYPIVGSRYKCSVLEDFDLCESCEAEVDHPYPLLKIKNQSQAPSVIVTIFDDEHHIHNQFSKKAKIHKKKSKKSKKQQKLNKQEEFELFNKLLSGFEVAKVDNLLEFVHSMKNEFKGFATEMGFSCPLKEPKIENKEEGRCVASDYINSTIEQFAQLIPNNVHKISEVTGGISDFIGGLAEQFLSTQNCQSNVYSHQPEVISTEKSAKESTGVHLKAQNAEKSEYTSKVEPQLTKFTKEEEIIISKKAMEKQYSQEVIRKAKAILDIFPQSNFNDICTYISETQNKPLEELVLDYMSSL